MKVSLIQTDIQWLDMRGNLERAERLILHALGSDLYVLPEMFATGFATDQPHVADKATDVLQWMQHMAHDTGAAIAGSVLVREDDSMRNRLYFVTPTAVYHYDKHHLFTYGGEHCLLSPGDEVAVVEWGGVRFLLQVCYDLRFPCFSRNRLLCASDAEADASATSSALYDCALYVACWPASRRHAWDVLLMARAIENQCYAIGVNRVGTDPLCSYSGGTALLSPYGKPVVHAADDVEQVVTADLDISRLRGFRSKFPVLRDAD